MAQAALVTGATGLLGRQILKAFENAGWSTTGTGFSRGAPPKIVKVDIQDENEVTKVLDEVR
jgi:S-adenosylmethionine synthetase